MHWVRCGKRRLNLEYAILVEEHDDTPATAELLPGGVRVTLLTGRALVFSPDDGAAVLEAIDNAIDGSGPRPPPPVWKGKAVRAIPQPSPDFPPSPTPPDQDQDQDPSP